MIARFGGDEFTLLLDQLGSVDDATNTADRILELLRLPVIVAGRELSVTTSIGIAVSGTVESCADDLLREADLAMYVAKQRAFWPGSSRVTVGSGGASPLMTLSIAALKPSQFSICAYAGDTVKTNRRVMAIRMDYFPLI